MKTAIMKPGILVSLKTSLHGGVSYARRDLDAEKDGKSEIERWETTRVIDDPEEHDKAVKMRAKARNLISKHCTPTSFGLLCPLGVEDELNEAIRKARAMVDDFNRATTYARVNVYVLKGRIAETDEEATRAIASDVASLLEDMQRGIKAVDVKAIRDAATKARAMGAMLGEEKAEQVSRAIDQARKAAREIVKRVEKGGEDANKVLETISTKPIESARFAFLDLDGVKPPAKAKAKAKQSTIEVGPEPTIEVARKRYAELRDASDDAKAFHQRFLAECDGQDPRSLAATALISAAERAAGIEKLPAINMQRMAGIDLN